MLKEDAAVCHTHIKVILDWVIWLHLVPWEDHSFKVWRILLCELEVGF